MKKVAIVIIFLLALTLLFSLGVWQTSRGLQKAEVLSKTVSEPQDYQTLDKIPTDYKALEYRYAQLQGEWVNSRTFLLDNRIYQRQQGFEVLTLFMLQSGQPLLINRGWIEKTSAENIPPSNSPLPSGTLYAPQKGYTIGDSITKTDGWPKTSLYFDLEAFAAELNSELAPLVLVLDADDPDSLTRIWTPVVVKPERHYGYAVQWFGLTLVLLVFGFIWRKHFKS